MGKVKEEFFDQVEDTFDNEDQMDAFLNNKTQDDDNDVFENIFDMPAGDQSSRSLKNKEEENDNDNIKTTYTIKSLYEKEKNNSIFIDDTKVCQICNTTKNVKEYDNNYADTAYSNNKYILCLAHAIEMTKYEIEKKYGAGQSLVDQQQFAKVMSELQLVSDNNEEQVDIYNQYAEKLLTPKPTKIFSYTDVERVEQLIEDAPNAKDFIEHIALSIYSSIELNNNFQRRVQPILLVGAPGIGKTYIANKISKALDIEYNNIQLANINSSFEFVGLNQKWRSASVGLYAKALLSMKLHTGIVILDEIDKISVNQSHGSIFESLLQLLEIDTCNNFQDAYLGSLTLRSDDIFFIATANTLSTIPAPIISRFEVIEIQKPTSQQMINLINKIYADETKNWKEKGYQCIGLDKKIIELFEGVSVREIKNRLKQAITKSAYKNKKQNKKEIKLSLSSFLSDEYFDKLFKQINFENELLH